MRILILLSLAACTGTGGGKDTGTDTGTDTVVEVIPDTCTGFAAEPTAWQIEAPLVSDYFMFSREGLGKYWSLYDLTGDSIPDLIQHAHGSNAAADEMGAAWYVWPGTGSGFGARVAWVLPTDHRDLSGLYAANFIEAVLDINGDQLADLVLARDPETGGAYGSTEAPHWEVYLGDGASGFATTAVAWSLPASLPTLAQIHGGTHVVRDIDGDGVAELIETRLPDGSTPGFADGDLHWRLYRVSGDGYAETPEPWPLPPSPDGRDGAWPYWIGGTSDTFLTQDITGDGLPDLIDSTNSAWPFGVWGEEGAGYWKVYRNTGSGFAASPIEWSVPDLAFEYPSSQGDFIYSTDQDWLTAPLAGGMPHLFISHDFVRDEPFVEDGEIVWTFFRNEGDGFSNEHTAWSIPDDVFSDSFWSSGGGSVEGWHTTDLTGDGCADLVLTAGLDLGHPEDGDPTWTWWVFVGQ